MQFENVAIETLAHVLPDEVWSSDLLEEKMDPLYSRLKLPQGRLELMTGIKERRFWSRDMLASEASALAGEEAMKKSSFDKSDIELLVHSAVCRDRLEPATAAYVHGLIGMGPQTQFMDISNACLGFLNSLLVAGSMIESGQIQRALIVSGENGRPLVERTIKHLNDSSLNRNEIKPYFANFTIGAGSVAAVLCHKSLVNDRDCPTLMKAVVEADSGANKLCEGGNSGDALEMQTDSEELLEAGVALAANAWKRFKTHTGWDENTPDHVICHQVGKQHQIRLFEALGLSSDKDFSTFPKLGNVGSVSLPITLSIALEEGRIKSGDKAALLGIGSGLSTIMLSMMA